MHGAEAVIRALEKEGVNISRVFLEGAWPALGAAAELSHHQGVFPPSRTPGRRDRRRLCSGYRPGGVAMTGTGPGATNTLTGIADCYADNVPVLLLMGQHPLRNLGKEYQQEVSASIFDGLVKWRGTFTRVDDIPGIIRRAFTALRSGSPGPVVLEMPQDVLRAEGPDAALQYDPVGPGRKPLLTPKISKQLPTSGAGPLSHPERGWGSSCRRAPRPRSESWPNCCPCRSPPPWWERACFPKTIR